MSAVNFIRDQSKIIPDIPLDTQKLRIWACKYKNITSVGLLKNLKELSIFAVEDNDFSFLSELKELKYLSLIHAKNIKNIEFLYSLNNIETLVIATSPSWDSKSKTIILDSIKPITNLSKLKHLELFGVINAEKSLQDLIGCSSIKTAKFSQYPSQEVDHFYEKTGASRENSPDPFL